MSRTVGLELTTTEVLAVRLRSFGGGVLETRRVPWDPAHPEAAVTALRAAFGPASQLAVAVGLGFLELKRVELPPAPIAERERMLQLEPDRYFAVGGTALVTALDEGSGIAFAAPRELLERWTDALEMWAPVERVEAAPVAVARVVDVSGRFVLDTDAGTPGVLEMRDRRLQAARRLAPHTDRNGARPLPAIDGAGDVFHAALGAARGIDGPLAGTLASDEQRAAVAHRRRRALWGWSVAAAAAVLFSGWAFERWQERELAALNREAGALTASATPALDAQRRLVSLGAEVAALRSAQTLGAQPLAALAALSQTLPPDAVVTSARMQGDEWEVDGTAREAARLLPILDQSGRFEQVRSRGATSRFNDRGTIRESFSIAVRFKHAPAP